MTTPIKPLSPLAPAIDEHGPNMPNGSMTSRLADSDMQGAPKALLRAAQRAREIARQTNTPLVVVRNGVLIEEYVTDDMAKANQTHLGVPEQPPG